MRWLRAATHPQLPHVRACPTQALDSSDKGLAAQWHTLFTTRTGGTG